MRKNDGDERREAFGKAVFQSPCDVSSRHRFPEPFLGRSRNFARYPSILMEIDHIIQLLNADPTDATPRDGRMEKSEFVANSELTSPQDHMR